MCNSSTFVYVTCGGVYMHVGGVHACGVYMHVGAVHALLELGSQYDAGAYVAS